jgi:hypothetical protein
MARRVLLHQRRSPPGQFWTAATKHWAIRWKTSHVLPARSSKAVSEIVAPADTDEQKAENSTPPRRSSTTPPSAAPSLRPSANGRRSRRFAKPRTCGRSRAAARTICASLCRSGSRRRTQGLAFAGRQSRPGHLRWPLPISPRASWTTTWPMSNHRRQRRLSRPRPEDVPLRQPCTGSTPSRPVSSSRKRNDPVHHPAITLQDCDCPARRRPHHRLHRQRQGDRSAFR